MSSMYESMYELIYNVNGYTVRIQQRKPGEYIGYWGSFSIKYGSVPNAHKVVLLTFLADLRKLRRIDEKTATWPEEKMRLIN